MSSLLLQPLRELKKGGKREVLCIKKIKEKERNKKNMEKERLRCEDRKMRKRNRGKGASMDELRWIFKASQKKV